LGGLALDKRLFIGLVFILFIVPSAFASLDDAEVYYSFDDDDNTGSNPDDLSGNGNDGTNTGGTTGVTGILEQAYSFGTSDNILVAGTDTSWNVASESKTFSLWYKGSSSNGNIMGDYASGTDGIAFFVNSDNSFKLELYASTGFLITVPSTYRLNDNTWKHLVVVINPTSQKVYIDGTERGSNTISLSGTVNLNNFRINCRGDGASGATSCLGGGTYDEFGYYDRELSSEEVTELYNSGDGFNPYASSPSNDFFTVTAQTYTNHSLEYQLKDFNVSLSLANGSSYDFTTSVGNLTTNINESINANITLTSTTPTAYINQAFTNYNLSTPLVFNYSVLNITAQDGITSGEISSFNLTFNGATSQSVNKSVLLYTDPDNYTFTGVSSGYNSRNFSYNTILNASDYTMTLYGRNSVLVNIYNATSSVKLSQSATILVEGTNFTQSYTTSDGDEYIQNLTAGSYDFTITSTGFQSASYIVTVGENTFQTLNAYLSEETGTDVTFTFKDQSNGAILEGLALDVEQFVNTSYILVNSLTSDISGRVRFAYVSGARYRLTASLENYEQKQFILDPVIFSSYVVQMYQNISEENLLLNAEIGIKFTPKVYYDDTLHNFSITFSSPTGDFLYYNYTVTVSSNGNVVTGNGANAYGGTLTNVINITNANVYDQVILSYRYVKSDGTDYTQTRTFTISNTQSSVFSFLDNAKNPFGLSLFERVVILLITTLIGSGVAFWFGGLPGSLIVAVLIFGYFGAVGIVPMWSVWASITIGSILFIWGASK